MANGTQAREARASVKYARLAPNKARFVLDQIRGLHVEEARRILQFSTRGASEDIAKVLEAAIANARIVLNAEPNELFVTGCWADEGPTLKRWEARAQGRANRLRRRTTHITLVVRPGEA